MYHDLVCFLSLNHLFPLLNIFFIVITIYPLISQESGLKGNIRKTFLQNQIFVPYPYLKRLSGNLSSKHPIAAQIKSSF